MKVQVIVQYSLYTAMGQMQCSSTFLAERQGLPNIACLTTLMFGGVLIVCTGSGGFFFAVEAVDLQFCIHKWIVLQLGTLV
jgi:hypothetical protein